MSNAAPAPAPRPPMPPGFDPTANPQAAARAAAAYAKATRPFYKKKRWWLLGAAVLIVIIAISSNSGSGAGGNNNVASTTTNSSVSTNGSGTKAASGPDYSPAQQQVLQSAQNYLSMGKGFSRAGLVQQLSSKAGSGYSRELAVFAVNHIKVNWNAQAVQSAKNYMQMGAGFSRSGLIQQLTSKAGDQFTVAQARYAAHRVGL